VCVRQFCPKFAMNAMCDNRPHQGLLLDAASLRVQSLAEGSLLPFRSEPGKSQIVLVLDEIVDPANVGGILRSGYFFGVSGILSSEKNTAPISAVAAKASAGMSEVLASEGRLFSTRNLAACLEHHKPAGWRILGTAVERGASTLRDIPAAPLTLLVGVARKRCGLTG
jgi:21S rRNA (GM2251-2'-O)-methyltransferase